MDYFIFLSKQPEFILSLLLSFILGALFYKHVIKRESDTIVSRRESRKALESKKRKEAYPKNYPNSWFKLMNSSDLKVGETKCILCQSK